MMHEHHCGFPAAFAQSRIEPFQLLWRKVAIGLAIDQAVEPDQAHRKTIVDIVEARAVVIEDLGSTNGVKVNGRRLDASRLRPGDEVVLGTVRFIFDVEQ